MFNQPDDGVCSPSLQQQTAAPHHRTSTDHDTSHLRTFACLTVVHIRSEAEDVSLLSSTQFTYNFSHSCWTLRREHVCVSCVKVNQQQKQEGLYICSRE